MPYRKTTSSTWDKVDQYYAQLLAPQNKHLQAALKANRKAKLPAIDVSPLQGKFLQLLVQMTQAKRVLEIGMLGGYSTIWMAQALPKGGRIVSLEYSPRHAEVASQNLANAGLLSSVEIHVGAALDTLPKLAVAPGFKPFDFVFIDADKGNNSHYLEWAVKLSRPGSVIFVDNVVRDGAVTDARSTDPDIKGTRRMAKLMASHPKLNGVALQNVGIKGYDGFAMAVVLP